MFVIFTSVYTGLQGMKTIVACILDLTEELMLPDSFTKVGFECMLLFLFNI